MPAPNPKIYDQNIVRPVVSEPITQQLALHKI